MKATKDNTNLNRIRSVSRLNMNSANNQFQSTEPTRTKSENELASNPKLRYKNEYEFDNAENFDFDTQNNTNANAAKFSAISKTLAANSNYLNNRVKSVAVNSNRNMNSNSQYRSSTRLENGTSNGTNNTNNNTQLVIQRSSHPTARVTNTNLLTKNSSIKIQSSTNNKATPKPYAANGTSTSMSNTNNNNIEQFDNDEVFDEEPREDFRIIYPGYTAEIVKPTANHYSVNPGDVGYNIELFEANPYNIMSDPVISEQFRKLYEEDEYFQQVHKKCCEWLNKYVFPEYEKERVIQLESSNKK